MAYTPKTKQTFESGKYGVAKVKVEDGTISLKLTDKEGNRTQHQLQLKNQSAEMQEQVRNGTWKVSLSGDETKLYSISPIEGSFKVKFVGWVTQKDNKGNAQEPAPKHYSSKNSQYNSEYDYMTAILKVTEGEAEGMTITLRLRYNFAPMEEEIEGNTVEVVAYSKSIEPDSKSEPTKLLNRFMVATGMWERGPIKWRDNILPVLQKRAFEQDREFGILLEDGWVKAILVNSSAVVEDFDE